MARVLAVSLALLLPWWPGGSRGFEPEYRHRVRVINDVGGNAWYRDNLRDAIADWNSCRVLRLVLDNDVDPFTPKTITVFLDNDDEDPTPAYGGWNGTAGIVAVDGGWTRSQEVLTHEIGHALGFGHTNKDSIMGDGHGVQPIDCKGLRHYY